MTHPKFDDKGLVPVIAQDARTGQVLMQAFMNREAFDLTVATGEATYFSRSRNALWKKGETSGNVQHVAEVVLDCDGDSVLLKVEQVGVACHTGAPSCFHNPVKVFKTGANAAILYEDAAVIAARAKAPQEGSYTNYLLAKGIDKICKKIGEEATEVVIAAKNYKANQTDTNRAEFTGECADLLYHLQVLLFDGGLQIDDVFAVLKARREAERKREY
ncbi:MAG: bifunctional phosphoribosyl-AMP cyclohydrolase/phosphoribosyl-ATP diphosphatase HisIE [Clostridiales bacterium]|jgi:phosphoribosyl-ATP pyrophosphohydrolase/phosphoribosyl-AMP cyclohydrolase|nr:bifunctional phosphoribosyl-AMP cyclohydrolase/phosphoribosyl-ATP diphosphatase HisIE [Clostridiales bacterium]